MSDTHAERIELQLRHLLEPVELVCEAPIPPELVDAAEEVVAPRLRAGRTDALEWNYPATYVTYLTLRGSERYTRNAFWPGVNVDQHSSEAGEALLGALHRLRLPDFQDEVAQDAARRFVAPALVHGALPSAIAGPLVELVEFEMRRGVLDGAELRRRLVARSDIDLVLHRPARRLMEWCADYATQVLDAIIGYIEQPGEQAIAHLPAHLQQALKASDTRRGSLKRLTPPAVEFQLWSGLGPEVVGRGTTTWYVKVGSSEAKPLHHEQRRELPPGAAVTASAHGRTVTLLEPSEAMFFDVAGRPLSADALLPSLVIALIPSGWAFFDSAGEVIEEEDEGALLSGVWSRYRSCTLRLRPGLQVLVGPRDGPTAVHRRTFVDVGVHLLGEPVQGLMPSVGGAVYAVAPQVVIPGVTMDSAAAWLTDLDGLVRFCSLELDRTEDGGGVYRLPEELTARPLSVMVQTRTSRGLRSEALGVTVLPGVHVELPDTLLGPNDESAASLHASGDVLRSGPQLAVPRLVDSVPVEVTGLPSGAVRLVVPRLTWAMRSEELARMQLEAGAIAATADELAEHGMRLTIRCSVPVRGELALNVDGVERLRAPQVDTRSLDSTTHQASISLAPFRDTIRQYPDHFLELVLHADGQRFVVASAGHAPAIGQRRWDPRIDATDRGRSGGGADHLGELTKGEPESDDPDVRRVVQALRRLPGDAALIEFLTLLGERSRRWKVAEFPSGDSGNDWRRLDMIANGLWRTSGIRYRDFTEPPLGDRLSKWARTKRESIRKAPPDSQQRYELWTFGRRPALDRLKSWGHLEWVLKAAPSKSKSGAQWFPAAVLFHCLALVAGEADAGAAVAEAVDVDPDLVLETVAFILQALSTCYRLELPILSADDDEAEGDPDEAVAEQVALPPVRLDRCTVAVHGRRIVVRPPEPSETPVLRLSRTTGHGVALLRSEASDGSIAAECAPDVDGTLLLTAHDPRNVGLPDGGLDVSVPPAAWEPPREPPIRDLQHLAQAKLDHCVDAMRVAIEAGRLPDSDLLEELFTDGRSAAAAIQRAGERWANVVAADQLAIAVLPTAFLSSTAHVDDRKLPFIAAPVLRAVVARRTPDAWAALDWPNRHSFSDPRSELDDLVGFAKKYLRHAYGDRTVDGEVRAAESIGVAVDPSGHQPAGPHRARALPRPRDHDISRAADGPACERGNPPSAGGSSRIARVYARCRGRGHLVGATGDVSNLRRPMTHHTLDPLVASARIEADYRSYLATSFAPITPSLREDFVGALTEPGRIRKGPLLQATPPYRPGASVAELVADGVLHRDLLHVNPDAMPPTRPLYLHQQEALRKAHDRRNLIVATGTGSGKTECYLLPVLDHLLREREAGTLAQPGVRALLLYPMNALANDQMKRIRDLFSAYPEITFGRYVGDTEHDPNKALTKYRAQLGQEPPPGEVIDRAAIQAAPPHVLLTNFAMLEYLLLRPNDSTIFDGPTGGHWRFLVLDEVHVYDGAKGAEVAMLLRRVRDRVRKSVRGQLQCMGTSATLGRGRDDSDTVASFAAALFDEEFTAGDVVHPERLPLQHSTAEWSLQGSQLINLHTAWKESADGASLASVVGSRMSPAVDASTSLWELLHNESHVVELQRRLEAGSPELVSLTDVVADLDDPANSLVRLVDLCIAARRDTSSAPLIPARYHLWLRASEGSFVCLHPQHPTTNRRVRLDRFERCPDCARARVDARMFELAVCRHCRAEYLVGQLEDDVVGLASGFERNLVHLVPGEVVDVEKDLDEDEEAVDSDAGTTSSTANLCLSCGTLAEGARRCSCASATWLAVTRVTGARGELKRCVRCKRHSPNGVALRFMSGSEAPVAVIATSLYQELPPAPTPPRRASAEGRKLLMFSDSRQDAAFFAPYLGRTYGRAVERRLLWDVLAGDDEPLRFADLVPRLRKRAERLRILDEDAGMRANEAEVAKWVMAEILATDRRQSIDGVGLAEISPALPVSFDPPRALTDAGLSDDQALDVTRVLLDSLRQSAAVLLPDEVDVTEDLRFAPRNTISHVRGAGSSPGVLAWLPGRGTNRRVDYLAKVYAATGVRAAPIDSLRSIWDELTDRGAPIGNVLKGQDVSGLGVVYGLSHERIEFRSMAAGGIPHRCSTCRQVWWRNVASVCPTYKCEGRLEPVGEAEQNHYADLYRHLTPLPLTVEEHTGQLRPSRAADLQERFTRGELNALSCSTTFELGVDVGEVQAVLMRNVPPSPANYVQRAGRAGRRLGSAALVVAFAQRRSHDRTYFDRPDAMVDGVIAPPYLATDNESIVRRHIHSVAFAQFERERVDRGAPPLRTIHAFVDGGDASVAASFIEWLQARPASLQQALGRLVPAAVREAVGVDSWAWVERLMEADDSGFGGWLTDVIQQARSDFDELARLEVEASEARQHRRAEHFARTRRTLEERRLIDQFAQRGVLPKYGFPVDVVDLDVSRSEDGKLLELNRDLRLGILEFAPGAKVVAANKLWTSVGLRTLPGRQLPEWFWSICGGCGTLRTQFADPGQRGSGAFQDPCAYCGSSDFDRRGRFVIPLFGFVGEAARERPGESRPPREGFLETYFAEFDGPPPATEIVELGGVPLPTRASRRGWVTVFNRGRSTQGFGYCSSCGHAVDSPPRPRRGAAPPTHTRPNSTHECRGTVRQIDLGHRFITNVLELQLPAQRGSWPRHTALLSALHALISATPSVGISQNDVGGSLAVGANGQPVVVLFDDVPGGAGHTRFLKDRLADLVTGAVDRLATCSCGEDTSCYGCLRSFRNQRDHEQLVRAAALDVLRQL